MQKIILIGAIVVAVLVLAGYNLGFDKAEIAEFFSGKEKTAVITPDEAKTKALKFIEEQLVQPGTKVEMKEIVEEGGMYKLTLGVGGQDVPAYMTKDGQKFFPQAYDMDAPKKNAAGNNEPAEEENPEISKSKKPTVKLFVMSYCPFGTQAQKGILPVLETLGNKIDFKLQFVNYIMHDKKEIEENNRQYCVQKNSPAKLAGYLECFLKKGEGTQDACLATVGLTEANVNSCMAQTDGQFKTLELYADKSTWQGGRFPQYNVDKADNEKYGITGSPGLVINGTKINSARDPQSLLSTVCGAFETAPAECEKELSSTVPSSGFGEGAGTADDASCGD